MRLHRLMLAVLVLQLLGVPSSTTAQQAADDPVREVPAAAFYEPPMVPLANNDVIVWGAGQVPAVGDVAQVAEHVERMLRSEVATVAGDVRRICRLSEDQLEQLDTAAKGVIELTLQQWREQMEQVREDPVLQAVPLERAPAKTELAAAGDAAAGDAAAGDAAAGTAYVPMAVADPPPDNDQGNIWEEQVVVPDVRQPPPVIAVAPAGAQVWFAPVQQPWPQPNDAWRTIYRQLWTKALQGILTDTQQQLHEAAVAERVAFHRRAAVTSITAKIDAQLRLSAPQRDQVMETVDQLLNQRQPGGLAPFENLQFVPHFISSDVLRGVLDETQMACWNDWQQGLLMYSPRPFPPPAAPAPAQPGPAIIVEEPRE